MRPWLWWWRIPPAIGMAVIGVSLPNEPSAFGAPIVDHGAFVLAAVLLAVASFTDVRHLGIRIAAMGAAVLACGARAATIVLTASTLTTSQIVTGLVVWLMLAGAFVFATVVTDRLRALGG